MGTGRNDIFVEEKSKMGTENGYMPYMEMKVTWLDLLPVRRASGQRARACVLSFIKGAISQCFSFLFVMNDLESYVIMFKKCNVLS